MAFNKYHLPQAPWHCGSRVKSAAIQAVFLGSRDHSSTAGKMILRESVVSFLTRTVKPKSVSHMKNWCTRMRMAWWLGQPAMTVPGSVLILGQIQRRSLKLFMYKSHLFVKLSDAPVVDSGSLFHHYNRAAECKVNTTHRATVAQLKYTIIVLGVVD